MRSAFQTIFVMTILLFIPALAHSDVDVSDWVPVGPNAPSLAPTGRAPIAFKRPLREGEVAFPLCPKKGLGCQYVDEAGAALTDRVFDDLRTFANVGLARVELGGKWGFIDTLGAWVVEPKFDVAEPFADNGLASVMLGDKWGYINTSGEWAVEPKFDVAEPFADNGLASVKLGDKWGYINTSGVWVVEPLYDSVSQVKGLLFRVDYGNGEYEGLLKPDGTPLTFTQEEFRMAEIEGNQRRLEEELAKKDEEIKRLQEDAANAQVQVEQTQQASSACDHVYVGKTFESKGGFLGITQKYAVVGVSPKSESCLLYTSPSPRDGLLSRMPSSA